MDHVDGILLYGHICEKGFHILRIINIDDGLFNLDDSNVVFIDKEYHLKN